VGCREPARPAPPPPAPAAAVTAPASAPAAAAAGAEPWAALLAEAERAELSVGGLVMDLGTPDQHKFTRGGWRTGWGEPRVEGGVAVAPVRARRARLGFLLRDGEAPQAVVVRLRSAVAGQRLAVALDGQPLGEQAVGADFGALAFAVPPAARRAGPGELTLSFTQAGAEAALVDFVWLRTAAGAGEPLLGPRTMPLRLGAGARRTLAAPTPRRYSFYLHELPAQAALRFEYGGRDPVRFVVRAHVDGQPARELFRAAAAPRAWRRGEVSLAAFAGQTVRLDLVTEGPEGVAGWAEPEIVAPPPPAAPPPRGPAPRGVVVVVMDATRAELFPAYDPHSPVVAPAFAELATEATVYRNAYSNANWTKPSGATLVTGLYPRRHGVRTFRDRLPAAAVTIGQRLARDGVRSGYFNANPQIGSAFGFGEGWDYALRSRELDPNAATWTVKPDPADIFSPALAWIKQRKGERFYAHLHTMGAHAPYRFRPGCTERYHPAAYTGPLGDAVTPRKLLNVMNALGASLTPADEAWIKALYRGEAACHDPALGRFVAGLKEAGLLDTTLLVVTADHGEATGEHGLWAHGWSVYDEETRVPLLVRYPPLFPAGARVVEPTELVDLYPTVLDALGLPPQSGIDGASLLAARRGAPPLRPAYTLSEHMLGYPAFGLRCGRYKLITTDDEIVTPEPPPPPGARWLPAHHVPPGVRLYDLATDADETRPRDDLPIVRRALEVLLGEGLAVPSKARRQQGLGGAAPLAGGKAVIDAKLKRQLEALGYLAE
jgi:arylsulfatase A-like enzyme